MIVSSSFSAAAGERVWSAGRNDGTRLLLVHGQATRVTVKCEIEVSLETAARQTFKMNYRVLLHPGCNLLLGLDRWRKKQMSAHPRSRSVSITGRKINSLLARPKMDKYEVNVYCMRNLVASPQSHCMWPETQCP